MTLRIRVEILMCTRLTGQGKWIAATSTPQQYLKSRQMRVKGKDRELLLALVCKTWT